MKQPPCYSGRVEVLGGFLVNLSITMTEVKKPIIKEAGTSIDFGVPLFVEIHYGQFERMCDLL